MSNLFKSILDFFDLFPIKSPLAEVIQIDILSSSIKRIRLKGDFKKMNVTVGSYLSLKINYTQSRKYTVYALDQENGFLEILVYLHPEGAQQRFMSQLIVGDKVMLNKLRSSSDFLQQSMQEFVFFGDETSLGFATSLLSLWKVNHPNHLFIFELDEENKEIPTTLGLTNTLVVSKEESFRNEKWISQLTAIESNEWKNAPFILTGNAKSIQIIRKVIQDKTTNKVYTRGYWVEGIEGL